MQNMQGAHKTCFSALGLNWRPVLLCKSQFSAAEMRTAAVKIVGLISGHKEHSRTSEGGCGQSGLGCKSTESRALVFD